MVKKIIKQWILNKELSLYQLSITDDKIRDILDFLFKDYLIKNNILSKKVMYNILENSNLETCMNILDSDILNDLKKQKDIDLTLLESMNNCSSCSKKSVDKKYDELLKTLIKSNNFQIKDIKNPYLLFYDLSLLSIMDNIQLDDSIYKSNIYKNRFTFQHSFLSEKSRLYTKLKLFLAYLHAPELLLNDTDENYEKINNFSYFDFMNDEQTIVKKTKIKEKRKPYFG